jgi:hypothetical protein
MGTEEPMSARKLRPFSVLAFALLLAFAGAASGCLDCDLKPLNPCLVSSVNVGFTVDKIDKIDLLFMVDNSSSMKEEQLALSQQFKNIITVLTTGKRPGKPDFVPVNDLHLAVISSDLGTPGFVVDTCTGAGDDGVMQNAGRAPGCNTSYPRFLSYDARSNQPDQTANDFACVAMLGTDGCGFEQQLETSLKALWPSSDRRVEFVGDGAGGKLVGHGDGDNAGFLRTDPIAGLSLLAIVLVTDEEDCSVIDPLVLAPAAVLNLGDPLEARLAAQGLNTRCALNPELLYKTSRYVEGFRALRGRPDLVIFAAIVGVPPETVDEAVLAGTKFGDTASRETFYRSILDHPAMQATVNDNGTPADPLDDQINPSCLGTASKAYPPRRIVEVARGFGPNGIVQSICQSDFTPAVNAIIDLISTKIGAVCLPHPLVRNSQGIVDCDVIWELPPPGKGPTNTPTACDDPAVPFLRPVTGDEPRRTKEGGARCRVPQLAVQGGETDKRTVPTESDGVVFQDGWYYDTFSAELQQQCVPDGQPQRIGYTAGATPPKGVTIKLECLNQIQRLDRVRPDLAAKPQPAIGDPCSEIERGGQKLSGDAACTLELANGMVDDHMFCHAEQQVCVASCQSPADCPPAWVCDDRMESITAAGGRKHCVNPTCGDTE